MGMDIGNVPFALPQSRDHIRRIQSERKRLAFARARQAPWYRGRLDHIDAERLDDPQVWQTIPIIDKDTLRMMTHRGFMDALCIAPREDIAEYWRSGGSTGVPLFYPRSFDDVRYGLLSWARSFPCIGIGPGDLCHISFPIGIHPAGQIWARSAHDAGVGMNWVGAGNAVPSAAQLDLIMTLEPTVLIAMSSFALHLATIADGSGIDLAASSVRKVVCSAESLSAAKRAKITRSWGAEVFDVFGMSEAGLMGAEGDAHDGIHIWSDLFFVEVVDPETGRQLPEGEAGTFCVTPLWTGHATPFLRWNSGDIVTYHEHGESGGRFAELFPMIRHTSRTTGFFKIRGVNVNHVELEDLMFANAAINDFQAVLATNAGGLETLYLRIEARRGRDAGTIAAGLADQIKRVFEVTPEIEPLATGTLAREFEGAIKTPRFVDTRQ
jgi:phenylacetate-CoA ligase